MSLRRVDPRFVLPQPVTTALVLGLEPWAEGLREAGATVATQPDGRPQLAVAAVSRAREALDSGAPMVVLEGRGGRAALRAAPFKAVRLVPVPSLEAPALLISPDHPAAAAYAVGHQSMAAGALRRQRNRLVRSLISRGRFPEVRQVITIGLREPGPPFLVSAASHLGVPADAGWYLTLGHGDALTRCVFHLFEPGSPEPSWVLKFGRVPGYADAFDRDEQGLRLAADAGGSVAAHAPRLLGRFEEGGLPASLETAAPGPSLMQVLQAPGSRESKLRSVEAVAGWIVELGRYTAAPADCLAGELDRLSRDVIPRWAPQGASRDVLDALPALPAVLQHNDLGCWNIIARADEGFTAVDWESARRFGLPLWDLLYFLTDALARIDGAAAVERRDEHMSQLYRGGLPSSEILFRWVRRMAEALSIPETALGPLATLCWLHHGLSHVSRSQAVERHAPGLPSEAPLAERAALVWLGDDALGPAWRLP